MYAAAAGRVALADPKLDAALHDGLDQRREAQELAADGVVGEQRCEARGMRRCAAVGDLQCDQCHALSRQWALVAMGIRAECEPWWETG